MEGRENKRMAIWSGSEAFRLSESERNLGRFMADQVASCYNPIPLYWQNHILWNKPTCEYAHLVHHETKGRTWIHIKTSTHGVFFLNYRLTQQLYMGHTFNKKFCAISGRFFFNAIAHETQGSRTTQYRLFPKWGCFMGITIVHYEDMYYVVARRERVKFVVVGKHLLGSLSTKQEPLRKRWLSSYPMNWMRMFHNGISELPELDNVAISEHLPWK